MKKGLTTGRHSNAYEGGGRVGGGWGEGRGACVPLLINQAALLLPRGPENCLILHHYNALKKGAPFWSLLRSMLKARDWWLTGYMEMGGFMEIGGYREVGGVAIERWVG
jgi:hypothetical protein